MLFPHPHGTTRNEHTVTKIKCTNVAPLEGFSKAYDYTVCPECGGYFRVGAYGNLRTHNRAFPVGSPEIPKMIARKQSGDLRS